MPEVTDFHWEGQGVATLRRKPNELHYHSFRHGHLRVEVDDYVLVRNDDSMEPEDPSSCYIAQVKDLFDTGDDGVEPYKAKIQWFSRIFELPVKHTRQFQQMDYHHELVEDRRPNWDNVIDAESIFGKCVVLMLNANAAFEHPKAKNGYKNMPIFFCRYKFTGIKFICQIVDLFDNEGKGIDSLRSKTPNSRKGRTTSKLSSRSAKKEITATPKDIDEEFKIKPLKICLTKINASSAIESLKNLSLSESRCSKRSSSRARLEKEELKQQDISNDSPVRQRTRERLTKVSSCHPKTLRSKGSIQTPIRKCQTSVSKPVEKNKLDSTPAKKKKTVQRSLDFGGEEKEKCDVETTTTRSGRKVKSVNYQMSDIYSILSTPKKESQFSKKTPSSRRKPKFYIPEDSSDDESNYAPSDGGSSSDGSQHFSESPDAATPSSSRRKSSSKKNSPFETPKSKRRLAFAVTPKIPEREQPLKTPQTLLEKSRQRLHVSAVPDSLPCREEEFSDIYSFIESNLLNQTGGCMYISGVPGTGKTATVHEVIRSLQKEEGEGNLPHFTFVEVNGMKMTDPYQCYVQIFKKLTGEKIAPQQAANMLEKRFIRPGPKKEAVVLLVDELDKLWTRKQTVMYNIFDWPSKQSSKLIVVAIANTMDLPERLMKNRVSSRLGLTRKTFQPYTFKELQEIVMSRIRELQVFDSDAVQLVARKVAAVSGDARRALEICKRAAEIAEEGTVKVSVSPSKKKRMLVGMAHVDAALNQMFTSPFVSAIRGCSEVQKLFFRAVLAEFERTGSEETTLFRVYRQLLALCRFEGFHPPTSSNVSSLCVYLASSHLILIDEIKNDLYMKIRLNVSIDDVNYALTGRIC